MLHISSLSGPGGIGCLGKEAYRFADFLNRCGVSCWQVLPLNPVYPHMGFSPYTSPSAFAGNDRLLSVDSLVDEGLLTKTEIGDLAESDPIRFDFHSISRKMKLLDLASQRFYADAALSADFSRFCQANRYWLDDYSLFMAIGESQHTFHWQDWDQELVFRDAAALAEAFDRLAERIRITRFCQFQFFRQWQALKSYCRQRGIDLIGDIPIYVSLDGADVWSHPDVFALDPVSLAPAEVAGVPPDYFSADGQKWGNPLYRWLDGNGHLNDVTYQWWRQRISAMLHWVDLLRIDHFRGFEGYWAIPAAAETARFGTWQKGPGKAFFQRLMQDIPKASLLAEDLGLITPEVEALRDCFGFPGMKILQFAFDGNRNNPYLPCNFRHDRWAVYTGTHDNNTTRGWIEGSEVDAVTKVRIHEYLGINRSEGIHWRMIREAFASVAYLAIIPMQDLLGLGEAGRMNVPGKNTGNWTWRFDSRLLTSELAAEIHRLNRIFSRLP